MLTIVNYFSVSQKCTAVINTANTKDGVMSKLCFVNHQNKKIRQNEFTKSEHR